MDELRCDAMRSNGLLKTTTAAAAAETATNERYCFTTNPRGGISEMTMIAIILVNRGCDE